MVRGFFYVINGDLDKALVDFETSCEKWEKNIDALLARAKCLDDLGRFEEAITRYSEILENYPDNQEALYFLGCLQKTLRRNKDAKSTFNKFLLLPNIENLKHKAIAEEFLEE